MMMPLLALETIHLGKSWLRGLAPASSYHHRDQRRAGGADSIDFVDEGRLQGAFVLACSKRSRTRLAPTPTNIVNELEPEIEKKGTLPSPATALAQESFAGAW